MGAEIHTYFRVYIFERIFAKISIWEREEVCARVLFPHKRNEYIEKVVNTKYISLLYLKKWKEI